jgi:hypothetical protein
MTSRRQWVDIDLQLPPSATVEIDVVDGSLLAQIEVHHDASTLTLLIDTLRAAVVAAEDMRARLAEVTP